jgi:hypothetical protein
VVRRLRLQREGMDYRLLLDRAKGRDLACAVCGDRPAQHLLAAQASSMHTPDRDQALCDVHAAGLDESSGVSEEDLQGLCGNRAPESWS